MCPITELSRECDVEPATFPQAEIGVETWLWPSLTCLPAMALPGPLQAEHWFHPWLHGGSLTEQMGPLKVEKDSFLSIQPAGQGTWRSEVVTIPKGQVKQEQDELTSNH